MHVVLSIKPRTFTVSYIMHPFCLSFFLSLLFFSFKTSSSPIVQAMFFFAKENSEITDMYHIIDNYHNQCFIKVLEVNF